MNNTIQLGLIGLESRGNPAYMATDFIAELEKCDPEQTLYLDFHSEGGSVFEGFRMANAVEDWPGKVVGRVKVAAFSICSYIAMKCDEIEIAVNGFFMIHNPYTKAEGDDEQLARDSKLLSEMKAEMVKSYSGRTGMDADAVLEMMKQQPYIGADQAIQMGLADRVIEQAKPETRDFTPKNHIPSNVFAAMFAQIDGDKPATTPKEQPVTTEPQKPVAASVRAIKTAFPKASNDFIVKCMDEELEMEDVGEEYAKAMEAENEELKAQVSAMGEEITALKAAAAEPEEAPVAKKTGVEPVANAGVEKVATPVAQWNAAVEAEVAKGKTRQKAVMAANRNNPGLREQMLAR